MIYPEISSEKSLNKFFHSFKSLQLAKLLRQVGINKSTGVSAYEVFQIGVVFYYF